MFDLFQSNPLKKLDKCYQRLLRQAMEAQRGGDIRKYSELSEQAEEVLKQIQAIEKHNELDS